METTTTLSVREHVPCCLCGADNYEVVYKALDDREFHGDPSTFRASSDALLTDQLVRCRFCSLQYVTPRVPEHVVLTGYRQGEDPAYVSQLAARERTFARSLERIERAAPRKGRLLDVGTAAGAFVKAARDRGWDAEGCEPNEWLAEWGTQHYDIRIRKGDLLQQPYADASFDVITLWDVIEHIPDPTAVLQHCHALLKPGGVLVVNYPDIGSWIARILGRRWLFLSAVHLYYFDRRTIGLMLEKSGYRVEAASRHVQRLELDYILFRGSLLNRSLSTLARALTRVLRIGRVEIPYWLGQTFILGRKSLSLLWPFGLEM
jgi:2-polyprenyl-3-methyl-5-hydroxy-6-metoxy-1,4-benzoquinol methylase